VKLFLISEVVWLFIMLNILMTADGVALVWCTHNDISYDEEQQHDSGYNIPVSATVRPYQLTSSSDEVDSSMK